MKSVLVLDATQRSALAVTRSLGKVGVTVFTADGTQTTLAGCSRFSKQYFSCPSPRLHPERFVAAIASLCEKQAIDIVLPMTELTTTLLLEHRASLSGVTIPFPGLDTVDSLADKCLLIRLAESLNIPTPRTWYADTPTNLPFNLEELPYPLVLKPGKSWLCQQGQWNRHGVQFADNQSAARSIIESDPAFQAHPFLLQECISGHGEGVFALYDNGKPLAFFAHRRLREKPPRGGVSVLSESISVDPVLLSHARSLLDKANWHGVAMVEFKVAEDGTPYLMEVNTRFWGSLQLAIDAGVDFPYLLYQLACGKQPAPVASYKTGNRLRWLLGDMDNLYLTLKDRGNYSSGHKLGAILHFMTPSLFRTRHEVNRLNDMGPFWCELRQYVRNITRK